MKYKLIKRKNPQNPGAPEKWYATPVNDGKVTKKEIAVDIVDLSSLSRGDVSNVLESMIDILPKYMLKNKSVSLGEFGTMRVSFSSEGVDDPADFNVNKITGLKVIFTPGSDFKAALSRVHFEKSDN